MVALLLAMLGQPNTQSRVLCNPTWCGGYGGVLGVPARLDIMQFATCFLGHAVSHSHSSSLALQLNCTRTRFGIDVILCGRGLGLWLATLPGIRPNAPSGNDNPRRPFRLRRSFLGPLWGLASAQAFTRKRGKLACSTPLPRCFFLLRRAV